MRPDTYSQPMVRGQALAPSLADWVRLAKLSADALTAKHAKYAKETPNPRERPEVAPDGTGEGRIRRVGFRVPSSRFRFSGFEFGFSYTREDSMGRGANARYRVTENDSISSPFPHRNEQCIFQRRMDEETSLCPEALDLVLKGWDAPGLSGVSQDAEDPGELEA